MDIVKIVCFEQHFIGPEQQKL